MSTGKGKLVQGTLGAHAAAAPTMRFKLVAALIPAIPFVFFVNATYLVIYLPLWVFLFYCQRLTLVYLKMEDYLSPTLSPQMVMCCVVCYRAIEPGGYVWGYVPLMIQAPIAGKFMDLCQSALWDALEPLIIGQEGFGAGRTVHRPMTSQSQASRSVAGGASVRPPPRAAPSPAVAR